MFSDTPMLTRQEIDRQVMHIIIGIGTVTLIAIDVLSPFALFLLIIAGILVSLITKRVRLPFFSVFIDIFEREEVKKKFPGKGAIFFCIGALLTIKLFERPIALAAIMILALGDSVSHLVGERFGRTRNILNGDGKKLLEGTIAGTLSGFLGALLFVPPVEAFLGSVVAMIAEVVKIDLNDYTLDDNLVVPLVAGTVMLLTKMYL
jgi:dolichol kinase